MPRIFHEDGAAWRMTAVAGSQGILRLAPGCFELESAQPLPRDDVLLLQIDGERRWAVLVPDGLDVLHNGQPIRAGLRLLAHRDALAVTGADAVYFSTEDDAHVEAFRGEGGAACPRCRGDIRPGDLVVRCPGCGVVHHEAADRNCWTYTETCALCSQPTATDAGLRWTPEGL